jgi:single-strand DNA-binding protein
LGKEPETRFTGSGKAVCNFSLATDESFKDNAGNRQKRTEWHKIVVWGKQAEIAQQYLHKGSLLYLEGRIQTREWDDKNGQKQRTTEIVCDNFRMLGDRKRDEHDQRQPGEDAPAAAFEASDADVAF